MAYSETELFALMEEIPAFPHSGYRILQITGDINCPPKELICVIEQDPIMTMHLLKLVNSEHFGLAKKITSIKQAVVFLGVNTMKNLALGIAPMELLTGSATSIRPLTRVLRHCLATAIVAKKLARHLGFSEAQATDCYVAGLLHDFGKVALFKLLPDKYESLLRKAESLDTPFIDMEMAEISTNHAAVGELLGHRWQLPELIIQSMGAHHNPDQCAASPLLDCVFAANRIAKKIDHSQSVNPAKIESMPDSMVQRFGQNLDSLTASLGLIADEIDHTLLLTTIQEDGSMAKSMKKL